MVHFENSYQFGKKAEKDILPILQEFFKREIKEYTERFSKFDFYDEIYNYELKTRTNSYNKFPTTMITENKVSGEKKQIFIFNFTDAIYYIEYDKEVFETFQRQKFSRAGLKQDEKSHIYIPIDKLLLIKTKTL